MKLFSLSSLIIFVLFTGLELSVAQTAAVKFEVTVPSEGIKAGSSVFLAGSFNCWNPQDSLYIMKKMTENEYYLVVPLFEGQKCDYKYTLGDWNTVETSSSGEQIKNRQMVSHNDLVIKDTVRKWGASQIAAQNDTTQNVDKEKLELLNKMKDEMGKEVQGQIDSAVKVLIKSAENMLAENPDMELRKAYHAEILTKIDSIVGTATDFLWKITSMLSPEQKIKIMAQMKETKDPGVIIDLITKALVTPKK